MARARARIALILVVAVAAAAAVLWAIAGSGVFAADRTPGRVESAVARRVLALSIPKSEQRAANPFAGDATAWRGAADHFSEHCAVCHGTDGHGHSDFGAHMYPPVPDLASPPVQQLSDGALFSIIKNGVRWTGMPAFRSTDREDEIWRLVSFIRRVPTLTAADLAHGDADSAHHDADATHHDAEAAHHDGDRAHDGADGAHHGGDTGAKAAATIAMDGTSFQPAEVTVNAGDVVEWVNKDPFPHNVSADAGGLHSGDLEPDRSWRVRVPARGTIAYVCTLHPGMAGVIHVK